MRAPALLLALLCLSACASQSPPTAAGPRHDLALPAAADASLDRNDDGRPDQWLWYDGHIARRELRDADFDGRPDHRIERDADGRTARLDEDLDGDGRLETVSIFARGELVRRRSDSDADGRPDRWSFYRDGQLERHELDRNGDGFRDLVLIYRGGVLAREERDADHDGRLDTFRVRDGDDWVAPGSAE